MLLPHVVAIKEKFDPSMIPEEFSFSSDWARIRQHYPSGEGGELAGRIRDGSRDAHSG